MLSAWHIIRSTVVRLCPSNVPGEQREGGQCKDLAICVLFHQDDTAHQFNCACL